MSSSTFRTARPAPPDPIPTGSIVGELGRLREALRRLAAGHAGLARLEAKSQMGRAASDAAVGLSSLPFVQTGLIMFAVALAIGLSSWVGGAWAFLIVGALSFSIAGVMAFYAAARLKKLQGMGALGEELARDREVFGDLVERLRGDGRAPRERERLAARQSNFSS
ncbi:MAG TPA: phage holin family protein [Vulgatibacter sp.]|nr:phage holin family protein [Vulgatibacter sp.]